METNYTRHRSARRLAMTAAIILLFFPAQTSFGQNNCLQITRETQESLSTPPGSVFTTAVRVANLSPLRQKYEARLILPGGWRALTSDASFELDAGRSDIRLLGISVPSTAAPGVYQIHYTAGNDAVPPCWTTLTFDIQVEPLRNLQMQVLETPRYVVAGESFKALFALRNLGNEPSTVRLTVRSGEGWTARPDSSSVNLAPRETRTIGVNLETDPSLSQNLKYVIEMRADLVQDSTVFAVSSFPVEVVPTSASGENLFHTVPLQAKLRTAGQDGAFGTQVEIASGGTITDKGKERFELFLRTPDIQSRSVLGYRDEYRAGYASEQYELFLGDRSYELSPLTELARYAIGAEVKARMGQFAAGGFVNQTRFFSPIQREQAGFVSYNVDSSSSASVNFIRKADRIESNAVTLRGMARPIRQNDLDVELGFSTMAGAKDQAVAARFAGSEEWAAYDIRFVHAGTNYSGYYRDVEFRSASGNLQPWPRIRLEFYGRDERRNLNMDTALFVAPRDQYYLIGAGYADLLSVYYRINDQADRLPNAKYAARENAVQLRGGYNFRFANFIASAEFGSTKDRIAGQTSPFQRYQLSANVRPEAHQTYGASLEYSNEQFFNAGEASGRWSGSLSAGINLAQGTQIMASIQGSRTAAPFVQTYSLADLSIEQTFSFGHTVTLRARQSIFTPAADGKELAYMLEYSVPFTVPLTRKSTSGQLRGSVVDAETHLGIPGVILYAGSATAITDKSGLYLFPALKPGLYLLQVDLGTVGLDRVTTTPTPVDVSVTGGEETNVDIDVIAGGTIQGMITLYNFREPPPTDTVTPEYVARGGQPNVLVEMSRDGEVQRRITDNRGAFQFLNIRPGTWTLRIQDGEIPPYHYFDRDSVQITISPGGKQDVPFRILPRKRKIQILQEGKLQQERPAPPSPEKSPSR